MSDILKILDRIPIWGTLKALPKRVAALEARLDALEGQPKKAPGRPCPACGEPALRRTGKRPHPQFADLGIVQETWTCTSCGEEDFRDNDGR